MNNDTRPWLRYLARYIDTTMYGVIILMIFISSGVILGFLGKDISFLTTVPKILFSALNIILLIIIEALVLSHYSTTLGKKFLKINIQKKDQENITLNDAFMRTIKVWFFGLGLGIPLVTFFTQINAYGKLSDNGITRWDKEENFIITHNTVATWRIVVATVVAMGAFAFYLAGIK